MSMLNFNNIHKYSLNELNILIDVNSGVVHVIDDITYTFLENLEKEGGNWQSAKDNLRDQYEENLLDETEKEIKDLIEENLLFTPDLEIKNYQPPTNSIVKALCLHIAHDCNLRCQYCFAGQGPYGGDRSLMSEEVGKAAIEFLIKASGPRKHIEIDFFGGEPLLNLSVVKNLVLYGRRREKETGKILKFTLTTNCVLLNETTQKFLNDYNISTVLSLDGRKEIHDKMRPFANGQGSYDIIKDKIVNFVKSRRDREYYVRGTYTRNNLDFSEDVKQMVELGFKDISVEPVVSDPQDDYAFREEDFPLLEKEYEKLTNYYWDCYKAGKGFNFFHFNIDLDHGPCLPKRLSGCGSGREYLAVSPQGDLFPCHQFVGREEYKVGDVFTGVVNKKIGEKFGKAHVLNKEECRSCWARFYCSGGCHANNINYRGSILKPYLHGCRLQKKRIECAIYLQVKKHLEE